MNTTNNVFFNQIITPDQLIDAYNKLSAEGKREAYEAAAASQEFNDSTGCDGEFLSLSAKTLKVLPFVVLLKVEKPEPVYKAISITDWYGILKTYIH